jgi:hypothetical protein
MIKTQKQLLREYISFVIKEDDFTTPGAGGSALRNVVAGAAKKSASAVAGAGKKVGAAVSKTLSTAYEATKELGSLGILKADYEGVQNKYIQDLNNISAKHGEAMKSADDAFLNAFGPVGSALKAGLSGIALTAFFMNPVAFMAVEGGVSSLARNKKNILDKIDDLAYGQGSNKKNKLEPEKFKSDFDAAQIDAKGSVKKNVQNLNKEINKISGAKSLKDLKFSDQDIAQINEKLKNEENKDILALEYGKKIKLAVLLNSTQEQRNKFFHETMKSLSKTIPPSKLEAALTSEGGMIHAYDKVIEEIKTKIADDKIIKDVKEKLK